jgi:hypothetical protein
MRRIEAGEFLPRANVRIAISNEQRLEKIGGRRSLSSRHVSGVSTSAQPFPSASVSSQQVAGTSRSAQPFPSVSVSSQQVAGTSRSAQPFPSVSVSSRQVAGTSRSAQMEHQNARVEFNEDGDSEVYIPGSYGFEDIVDERNVVMPNQEMIEKLQHGFIRKIKEEKMQHQSKSVAPSKPVVDPPKSSSVLNPNAEEFIADSYSYGELNQGFNFGTQLSFNFDEDGTNNNSIETFNDDFDCSLCHQTIIGTVGRFFHSQICTGEEVQDLPQITVEDDVKIESVIKDEFLDDSHEDGIRNLPPFPFPEAFYTNRKTLRDVFSDKC